MKHLLLLLLLAFEDLAGRREQLALVATHIYALNLQRVHLALIAPLEGLRDIVAVGSTTKLKLAVLRINSRPHFVWRELLMLNDQLETIFFGKHLYLMLVQFDNI
jgi:hypothetical protein